MTRRQAITKEQFALDTASGLVLRQQASGEAQASLFLDFSGEPNSVEVEIAANRSGFYGSVSGYVAGAGSFANIAHLSIVMTPLWDFARVRATASERPADLFLDAGEAPDDEDWLNIDFTGVRNVIFETDSFGSVLSHYGNFLNFERFYIALGSGTNRVRSGDGDDSISSRGVDFIDGGGGVDAWSGNYAANRTGLIFRMEGTSGNLSNGTTLVNVEAFRIVTGIGNDLFEFINPTTEEHPQSISGGGGFDTLHADLSDSTRDTSFFNIRSTAERGYSGSIGGDLVDLGFDDIEAVDVIFGPADGWGRVDTGAISRTGGSLSIDGGDGYDTVAIPNLGSGYSIVSDGDGGFIINDIDRSNGDTGWFEVRNFEAIAFADQTVNLDALLAASITFGASGSTSAFLSDLDVSAAFI